MPGLQLLIPSRWEKNCEPVSVYSASFTCPQSTKLLPKGGLAETWKRRGVSAWRRVKRSVAMVFEVAYLQ